MTYRADIDGLRAIAVLAVVLFHFGVPGFQGGFVGVDIFFVISGFLIGGLLWRELRETGRIRLGAFYMRRIRRLAPAFFAMAIVSAVAAWFLLLPFDLREFGKGLVAAVLYLSNVLFYRQAGYFDSSAEEKVLLHSWSLSVEEQFYIVLPFLLLLLGRSRLLTYGVLTAVFFLSLGATIIWTASHQTAAFYLFPFRAWELLAGVLLAIWLASGKRVYMPTFLSWTGLALIFGSILFVDAKAGFPGYQAVFPVLGTVLLLAGGTAQAKPQQLLSHPVPVFFGLTSYSFYLWHWPVLVLALYWRGEFLGPMESTGWLLLSFALSVLSWRFVERPLRSPEVIGSKPLFYLAATCSAGLLAIGLWFYATEGQPKRFNDEVRAHIDASADFLQDFSRCRVRSEGAFAGLEVCPIGPEDEAPSVLIWGDSHLRAFHDGLALAAEEQGVAAQIIWTAGCPPFFDVSKVESASTVEENLACPRINERVKSAVAGQNWAAILLVGRWTYYGEGQGTGLDAHNTITLSGEGPLGTTATEDVFKVGAAHTVEILSKYAASVYVLKQLPEFPNYDSRQAARDLAFARAGTDKVNGQLRLPLPDARQRSDATMQAFLDLEQSGKLTLLNPWDDLCNTDVCEAPERAYFDNNHVTNHGARLLRHVFAPVFEAAK